MTFASIACLIICLGMLYLRMKAIPPGQKSTNQQRMKTARTLLKAALALAAVGYTLQRLSFNLEGKSPAPSLMERFVMTFSK